MGEATVLIVMGDKTLHEKATALILALEMKSAETGEHSLRVGRLSLLIGQKLGLKQERLSLLKVGALLHDIGKLSVPELILEKTELLTDEERELLRKHPWRGENLLSSLGFPKTVCEGVGQHHECFNGTGYPLGLSGEGITLEARIIAVADAFDTIRHGRCWRRSECYEVALHEVAAWADRQFDPAVVEALIQIPKEVVESVCMQE